MSEQEQENKNTCHKNNDENTEETQNQRQNGNVNSNIENTSTYPNETQNDTSNLNQLVTKDNALPKECIIEINLDENENIEMDENNTNIRLDNNQTTEEQSNYDETKVMNDVIININDFIDDQCEEAIENEIKQKESQYSIKENIQIDENNSNIRLNNNQTTEVHNNYNQTKAMNDVIININDFIDDQCEEAIESEIKQKESHYSIRRECTNFLNVSIPVQKSLIYFVPTHENQQFGSTQTDSRRKRRTGINMGPYGRTHVVQEFYGTDIASAGQDERQEFVQKVFATVLIMLTATSAMLLGINFSPLKDVFLENMVVTLMFVFLGAFLSMVVGYAFACSDCTKYPPMNCIMLVLIVFGYVFMGIPLIIRYKFEVIIYAFVATTIIVAICLALAFTGIDFTQCFFLVLVGMMALVICSLGIGLLQMVLHEKLTGARMAIMIIFCLLQSVMLIMELQMVLGGRQMELSTDMWAFGAFLLYSSTMNLFFKMVAIIGENIE